MKLFMFSKQSSSSSIIIIILATIFIVALKLQTSESKLSNGCCQPEITRGAVYQQPHRTQVSTQGLCQHPM